MAKPSKSFNQGRMSLIISVVHIISKSMLSYYAVNLGKQPGVYLYRLQGVKFVSIRDVQLRSTVQAA